MENVELDNDVWRQGWQESLCGRRDVSEVEKQSSEIGGRGRDLNVR